ncbi:MAG TPA: N-acetylmuramoyl-L-alanine amidase [Lachnospiraceae bacterium]|nr:N-acetylmuramoyl-L-alanine amidase [Lachnospiraceae bacterium]
MNWNKDSNLSEEQDKILKTVMAIILLISMVIASREMARMNNEKMQVMSNNKNGSFISGNGIVTSEHTDKNQFCVVVDPGHGGRDVGKLGINNALEKDVNLEVALLLKEDLEKNNIKVIMIRETDIGLYKESDSNKKMQDLKARIKIMEDSKCNMAISIHQNSYHESDVNGAQTFYYTSSKEGKKIAEIIQEKLILGVDPTNHRKAKENDFYFLLKKTTVPLVIVECGFLSNYTEAELLVTKEYQKKIAQAISDGIINYLTNK